MADKDLNLDIPAHPVHKVMEARTSKWDKRADKLSAFVGSWKFLGYQTAIITCWIILNIVGIFGFKWDPYPFILLNLVFSTQAAYAAPILQLSGNRQAAIDRAEASHDYKVNQTALDEIKSNTELTAAVKELVEEIRNNQNPTGPGRASA